MGHYFTKTPPLKTAEAIGAISQWSYPLHSKADLQPLYDRIGDARIVMLGEASHGTHEFYTWRTHISRYLIENKGFNFIAVEGDWPDCYRLNRFIKGYDIADKSAYKILQQFDRWPTWLWANWEIVALSDWLWQHNHDLPANQRTGFYGLDVYSLWESMEGIMQYLKTHDPSALKIAQQAYHCFEPYKKEQGSSYASASRFVPDLCRTEVIELLKTIRQKLSSYNSDHENVFSTEQNALIAVNAETYYRTMIMGGPHSWNVRDRHMADTLGRLLTFHGPQSKAIVWAHNTHIGDARATDMTDEGMYNIGELARMEHHEKGVVLIGFGAYEGTVLAGKTWGAPMQKMALPPAISSSWEDLLHQAGNGNKLLLMDDLLSNDMLMEHRIGHRAVGVVYNPAYERYGNYVPSTLPMRYDAFIFLENTRPLYALHITPDGSQVPETYPFGV